MAALLHYRSRYWQYQQSEPYDIDSETAKSLTWVVKTEPSDRLDGDSDLDGSDNLDQLKNTIRVDTFW